MNATDSLFAAKGQAQPVDQSRPDNDSVDQQETGAPETPDSNDKPLPDLFGEVVDHAAEPTSLGSDEETGDNEPLPAASLLSIISQRSAARRRPQAPPGPDTTPPATVIEDADKTMDTPMADDIPNGAAIAVESEPLSPNLPVPVVVNLPVATDVPVTKRHNRVRRIAALAACAALVVTATLAMLTVGPASDTDTVTGNVTPSAAAGSPSAAITTLPVNDDADKTAITSAIVPETPETKIDTVKIDVKGLAVISGQAPPEAELIVLHNRRPLGTARSDAAGDWTFSAPVPTRTSRNEISIVPLRIDNSVMVTGITDVPRPGRRPSIPSYYFAQIASLPSAADAGREAAKLGTKLSGIIDTHQILVRVATLENDRKVYRVSIGGFSTKARAADICNRIRARNTNCLVIRGS